jgi:hypothetical protein
VFKIKPDGQREVELLNEVFDRKKPDRVVVPYFL